MNKQSERVLEENFIETLHATGYQTVTLRNEEDVRTNLKQQLGKHNHDIYTDSEFQQILNYLAKGSIYERAEKLRDKMPLKKEDGTETYVEFLNQNKWCENQFQVTHQVTQDGAERNRYDVTILINGLPLVHVELKKSGVDIGHAFKQIIRYKRDTFWANYGLWDYVQIFIISNGRTTKYYCNNHTTELNYKQTFFWTDKVNTPINELNDFAHTFLSPCQLSMMIVRYIVLNSTEKKLMVMRPYQVYATEAIINRVNNTTDHGYIWHTTGSGKTLTSFKTSQILTTIPKVYKVVFVVDRKDLDYQTINEFNAFEKGCVDPNNNTADLTKRLNDNSKLVVTTIQKLKNVISRNKYEKKVKHLKGERFIFIFDECHRNQFGKTRAEIENYFEGTQMFGFTGTPIFTDNAVKIGKIEKTTEDLFIKCLHKYVINDAIADGNVLGFRYEHWGMPMKKDEGETEKEFVSRRKSYYENDERKESIAKFIGEKHKDFTYGKEYTGMFCVSSVKDLIQYYEWIKQAKIEGKHDLRVATIFSCSSSQMLDTGDEPDELGGLTMEDTRGKLEEFVKDYNKMYDCNHSVADQDKYYLYYQNLARRVKNKEVDVLLVVSMFLTGFDAKSLNTLYVDKNLKLQNLIQAYSRTNRVLTLKKKHGQIVSFRDLKEETDEAIKLYSNKKNKISVLAPPYRQQKEILVASIKKLHALTPDMKSVDALQGEAENLDYLKAVREVNRCLHETKSYKDFNLEEIKQELPSIKTPEGGDVEQWVEDHKSKYLTKVREKQPLKPEKEYVQPETLPIDPEIELLERYDINVDYILSLLAKSKGESDENRKALIKDALRMVENDPRLASSKQLLEKFAYEELPDIENTDDIKESYIVFVNKEKNKSFSALSEELNADHSKLLKVVEGYQWNYKQPDPDVLVDMHIGKLGLIARRGYIEKSFELIKKHVELYDTEK